MGLPPNYFGRVVSCAECINPLSGRERELDSARTLGSRVGRVSRIFVRPAVEDDVELHRMHQEREPSLTRSWQKRIA